MSIPDSSKPQLHTYFLENRFWYSICILAIAVFTVYWPVLQADFVEWDDGTLIYANKNYHPVTPESMLRFWQQPYQKLYTPITYSVMGVLALLARVSDDIDSPPSALSSQLDPRVFHAFSLIVHLLSTFLVWWLLRRLIKSDQGALAGALLWSLHPMQVETVAWAGEIKGLLAGFFSLASLNIYVSSYQREDSHFSILSYLCATICFLLALLSKPSAVCLPFVATALGYYISHNRRHILLTLVPWFIAALIFSWVARGAQPVPSDISSLWVRPFIAGDALSFYIWKIVFPGALQMIYGRTPTYVLSQWWGYITWVVPFLIFAIVWPNRRNIPYIATACAIFATALLPNLGLVPFIYQRFSTVADRYVYLAMLGPAILLAGWIASRGSQQNSRVTSTYNISLKQLNLYAVLITLYISLLGTRAVLQVPIWNNSLALWTYNIQINPENWALVNNVGVRELEQGRPEKALIYLARAAHLRPDDPEIRSTLAATHFRLGHRQQAKIDFNQALKIQPGYGRALLGLANIAREEGNKYHATRYYKQALASRLEPEDVATAHTNLGAMLSEDNHQDDAIKEFVLALKDAPNDAQTYDGLALALARKGNFLAAENAWQKSIEINESLATARINYGTLLAMQNRLDAAEKQWKKALDLLPGNSKNKASVHNNLAIILWSLGRKEEAIFSWRSALKINPHDAVASDALKKALKSKHSQPASKPTTESP